jgi:hypothetical protein
MKALVVKKIGKKGKGVFANRNFRKGELILKIGGKRYTSEEAYNLPSYARNHICITGDDEWTVMGYPEKYINHSCSPNVFDKKGKTFAIRNIKKGEELSFDYTINGPDGEDWTMKCHCKSKDCRKQVTGEFFKLPKKTQKKYIPYLDDWFKKKYRNKIKEII